MDKKKVIFVVVHVLNECEFCHQTYLHRIFCVMDMNIYLDIVNFFQVVFGTCPLLVLVVAFCMAFSCLLYCFNPCELILGRAKTDVFFVHQLFCKIEVTMKEKNPINNGQKKTKGKIKRMLLN